METKLYYQTTKALAKNYPNRWKYDFDNCCEYLKKQVIINTLRKMTFLRGNNVPATKLLSKSSFSEGNNAPLVSQHQLAQGLLCLSGKEHW